MSHGTGSDNLDAIRQNVLMSLDPDIQSEIQRLENKAPESAVTAFIDKTLKLGRAEKLKSLDQVLNGFGESISSFSAVDDLDSQARAVACIETILNMYSNEVDKKKALEKLDEILN